MTDAGENFQVPLNFSSLVGVYLAINAIPDAYLLVDGPDCTLYKAHFIHGRHDWNSTLLDVRGQHRVSFSNVCSQGVVLEHDDVLRNQIRRLDAIEGGGGVIVTALPMCSITGVDYGRVIRGLNGSLTRVAIDVPPSSLVGDWLDGYAQTLHAIARGLELRSGQRRPRTAAIVGYLMDRNEGDHVANLAELRRMLAALGLETVSVWLGGEPISNLRRAEEAEWIISLPYGRRAAETIADRTGAEIVEVDVPFGLAKTTAFLRTIAEATGRESLAESFVDEQLGRVVPRLEWVLPHLFLHRRVSFVGDPHLLDGFLDIAEETGMHVEGAISIARRAHGPNRSGVTILHEPSLGMEEVTRILDRPDLLVACRVDQRTFADQRRSAASPPSMEFGFLSYGYHVLSDRPFLGYPGFLAFVERMAEHLEP